MDSPLAMGPDPRGSPLPMGPPLGGSPLALEPALVDSPIDMGPGPKGTPTAEGVRLQGRGLTPLRTPVPPTAGLAGAGCPVPGPSRGEPAPLGAERGCRHGGDPGGGRSGAGSCPPGAAVPALLAALAYCYIRDHLSKGDYRCSASPGGGMWWWWGAW